MERPTECLNCKKPIKQTPGRRPRLYCGVKCRNHAFYQKRGLQIAKELLKDMAKPKPGSPFLNTHGEIEVEPITSQDKVVKAVKTESQIKEPEKSTKKESVDLSKLTSAELKQYFRNKK